MSFDNKPNQDLCWNGNEKGSSTPNSSWRGTLTKEDTCASLTAWMRKQLLPQVSHTKWMNLNHGTCQ